MIIQWPVNKSVGDIYVSPTGAKWKWTGKAWVSLREKDVVYLGATQSGANYQFSHSPMDPCDNMTYYIGNISDFPAQSLNSVTSRRVKSLVDGKANSVSIMTQINGDLGSDESQTFILKNHTTGTSSVITSDYKHLSISQLNNYNLSNPLDISINDELEIIWEVGIFQISPVGIRHVFNVSIE